jgi:hypothetical protein
MAFILHAMDHDPKHILDAMIEMAKGSDRSVAIVGGTLVETNLRHALTCFMHKNKKITDETFRSTGAFGAFETKIRLGRLIGLYGENAHNDLMVIKKIRNKFAHSIEVKDFESKQISDWSKNFRLVERYTSTSPPLPKEPGPMQVSDLRAWVYDSGRDEKLKTPRGRFQLAVQVLCWGLIAASNKPGMPKPVF